MTETSPPALLDTITQAVHQQFADHPTLHTVTAQLLADNLQEKYPPLTLAPAELRLALPRNGGGRELVPLLDVTLNYLAGRNLPDLTRRAGLDCYLSDATGERLSYSSNGQRDYDLNVIMMVIRELPQILFIAFQEALATYWGQTGDAGMTRWQCLGDLLRTSLRAGAVRHTGLLPEQRRMLDTVLDHPDRQTRSQLTSADNLVHAYTLETVLIQAGRRTTVQASDILLVNANRIILCSAAGGIEAFASLDAFGQAWGQRFTRRYNADQVMWNRFEPSGSIFDIQAALLLAQQLDDLAAMSTAAPMDRQSLERRYQAITDLAPRLSDAPTLSGALQQPLTQAMPDWLKRANPSQRFYYFQHLPQLAAIKQRTEGRQFLDGLKDLRTYAADALFEQMQSHPNATAYRPEKLELTFAVPVGDLGSGYIEPVKMSFTELAVKNLSGKPHGRLTVQHIDGLPVPGWMNQAYIEGLVTQVDIGGRYPQWLNEQLLADAPQAHQREALFDEQMHVQLPIQALTLWTRGEAGFTRQGYRYIAALVNLTKADRTVDEQEIVIRPLAFLRQPGAAPDVVADMYIIEPRDNRVGPHILYRGQYTDNLRQFPSRAALLSAIATPGELQNSVLTWLPDTARAVYDHGGFHEPHLTRFVNVGSEFDPLTTPAPVQLAVDEANGELLTSLANGQLMSYLFGSYARTLIQIAEQTSTSNAESRWAVVLEGSWLLFNTLLLPLLRGPAMLAGWMLQMTPGLIQDIPNLNNADPSAREMAWVDLLVNLGLVLLHLGLPTPTPTPRTPASRFEAPALESLRRSTSLTIVKPALITPGIVGLPEEPPALGRALIDFKTSSACSASTERKFQQLLSIRVPWPDVVPAPQAIGPFRGLYRINEQWHAAVRGRLFPVNIVPGFGEVYAVSADHPQLPGIKLKTDGRGHWSIDEGLHLVGGGPKTRIAELRKRKQERIAQLDSAYEQFVIQQQGTQAQVDAAERAMTASRHNSASTAGQRAKDRDDYRDALARQTAGYVSVLDGTRELASLQATTPEADKVNTLLQNIIQNTRKEIAIADFFRAEIDTHNRDLTESPTRRMHVFATQGRPAVERYYEFLKQTALINERMIKAYETIDERLLELAQSPGSETTYKSLTQNRPNEMTALRLKGYQLVVLRMLCNPDRLPYLSDALDAAIDPIVLLTRSHAELRDEAVYSHEERVAVLGNVVEQYARTADGLQGIEVFNEASLERGRLAQLLETVQEMRQDAQQQLVQELKRAPIPVTPRLRGSKRVIKTPSGAMVGRARPRVADQGGEIVDVIAPFDERPLASYHEHAPHVWVKIAGPTVPAPPRMTYALAALKAQGKRLLEQMQGNIRRIEGYAQTASTPKEIHEQLQREAGKFEQLSQDLNSGFAASGVQKADADTRLIQNLVDGAGALTRKGIELRTQMALSRPPISEDVEFLLRTGELQAIRKTQRTQLKTGLRDFLQEYVLVNRKGQEVWFAHFHYPAKDTPKAQYTVAHLKTREQRFETYASLLAKEQDPNKVIAIHRALITTELAQQSFLPLSP